MIKNRKPTHPGVVLNEIYLQEMGLNQSQIAEKCKCSPRKINEIVNGERAISPDFTLVLEKVLETTAEIWARIQAEYDLWVARQKAA
jgi:addiction module HigA family antidote